MQSVFEFTGKFQAKVNLETKTETIYQNINEVFKSVNLSKTVKSVLNTGFISTSDIPSIESLIKAERAWLLLSSGELVSVVPITKELPSIDSDRELNSFDLEFQINRKIMKKFLNSDFELDLSSYDISTQEENHWFSTVFTKYTLPFEVTLTSEIDEAFGFISWYNSKSIETYFKGYYFENGKNGTQFWK